MYLNVAQFGPCVFGAGAASERFFEVPPAELTPEQAALLATVLPNPLRLRAHNPGPYARERRAELLADRGEVERILLAGAERARARATATRDRAMAACGLR